MAAERSRSAMDSPVPACMFAPEPSSPGAARAAAAAARLHGGFDSDCSEDGEALNGERELDLTSKGSGRRAEHGHPVRGERGMGGRGRACPPAGLRDLRGLAAGGAVPKVPAPTLAPLRRQPSLPPSRLPPRSQPLGSATWNGGAGRWQRSAWSLSLLSAPPPASGPHLRGLETKRVRWPGQGAETLEKTGIASLPGLGKGNRK
ncbi:hypothetical protein P7K49_003002 [Saguinus oedipus]|uniref:Uncharacterized protein n=1 Tax=Saguinus oedipus TaxID=9490 RepID=A0ABQ9WIY1_SAGOE|nr:hypothetical protein P7K49_003002 [Saguinus oedipus]